MLCHAFDGNPKMQYRVYDHIAQTVFCEREVILPGIRRVVFIG